MMFDERLHLSSCTGIKKSIVTMTSITLLISLFSFSFFMLSIAFLFGRTAGVAV